MTDTTMSLGRYVTTTVTDEHGFLGTKINLNATVSDWYGTPKDLIQAALANPVALTMIVDGEPQVLTIPGHRIALTERPGNGCLCSDYQLTSQEALDLEDAPFEVRLQEVTLQCEDQTISLLVA